MIGLCFSNKGIYKFDTTQEKVKIKELNRNIVEEIQKAETHYQ